MALGYLLCVLSLSFASSPPHILYIVADDLGWNDIGYRGNATDIETPNLDALAESGVKLDQFYSLLVCSPSRAAILTGRYPYKLGLSHGFIAAGAPYGLPLNETTMAQEFKKAGYATHMVGKWHIGMCSWEYTPTYRGFDTHFGFYNGAVHYFAHTHPEGSASSPLDFHYSGAPSQPGIPVTDLNGTATLNVSDYGPFIYARETVKVLQKHAAAGLTDTQPLFMFLTHQSTHEPIDAPPSYIDHFAGKIKDKSRRTFAGMALALDDSIKIVTDALKQYGFWENTLIVFQSDNGGNLKAAGNNWPLRGGKYTLFEGGTRVTAFVSGPALPKAVRGTTSAAMMHEIDFFPTLLAVAGASPSRQIDGINQWDVISTNAAPVRDSFIYNIDPVANISAIRVGDYKYIEAKKMSPDEWKPLPQLSPPATKPDPTEGPWLFNLADDPTEHHNLLHSQASKAAELRDKLHQAATDGMVYPWNAPGTPGSHDASTKVTCPDHVWTPGAWCIKQ